MDFWIPTVMMVSCYFMGVFTVIFHEYYHAHRCSSKNAVVVEQRNGKVFMRNVLTGAGYDESVVLTKYRCKTCEKLFYTAKTATGDNVGYSQEYIALQFPIKY